MLKAEVLFTENKKSNHKQNVKDIPDTPAKPQSQAPLLSDDVKQYHIEGYADSNYVKFVVEVERNKIIAGQMINDKKSSFPVHGELVDDVLHIYDGKGQHFMVVMPH